MKNLFYCAIGIFTTLAFAQNNYQEDLWFNFQTPAVDVVVNSNSDIADTPFVIKDKNGIPTNYTLPVYIEAISDPSVSDLIMRINQITVSYDKMGRQIIYLSAKIDLSCCYYGAIALDFYDANDKLIQKARTDDNGNFKIKSINGNLFEIKENKIKFNFTKLKSFDQNADVRFAKIKHIKRPLGTEIETVQEKSIVKNVVESNN